MCHVQSQYSVSTQFVSLIDLTQLDRVLCLDSISFIWRLKYSDVIPLTYTWKMAKEAPNHIPMNMIGLAQTSCKILEEGDILIFPVVLVTPKDLRHSVLTNKRSQSVSHYLPSTRSLI